MAPTKAGVSSSIAMAFNGRTASVDIPTTRAGDHSSGHDRFATVAARSVPVRGRHGATNTNSLPTPPNSISPNLPPLGFKRQHPYHRTDLAFTSPPAEEDEACLPMLIDSDIDLHDTKVNLERGGAVIAKSDGILVLKAAGTAAAAADAAGAITPGLAKHHLPEILLVHGPLAIRHVMAHLTTSVPGFSGIPPAKARRLVVGALEGRGSGGESGGVDGKVEFEKVGWGRWDARIKGQPRRETLGLAQLSQRPPSPQNGANLSCPPTSHSPSCRSPDSIVIAHGQSHWSEAGTSSALPQPQRYPALATSWAGDSAVFSHASEGSDAEGHLLRFRHGSTLETEADKMSLDEEDESCSSSDAAPTHGRIGGNDPEDDIGEVTDDEDWARIGAVALRQTSVSDASKSFSRSSRDTKIQSWDHGGARPGLSVASSASNPFFRVNGFATDNAQERDAIEALVRLSSV